MMILEFNNQEGTVARLFFGEDRWVTTIVGIMFVDCEAVSDAGRHRMNHVGRYAPMILAILQFRRRLVSEGKAVSATDSGKSGLRVPPVLDAVDSGRNSVRAIFIPLRCNRRNCNSTDVLFASRANEGRFPDLLALNC